MIIIVILEKLWRAEKSDFANTPAKAESLQLSLEQQKAWVSM